MSRLDTFRTGNSVKIRVLVHFRQNC